MNIRQDLVTNDKYAVKCPHTMQATRIVVHNTYNDASAKNEVNYMKSNPNKVSFHFAVDDIEVVQGIPLDRNSWNAGDGNGKGNREGISIEICYSKSGGDQFIKAEQNASKLIAQLLKERDWGIDKVTKHQDYSGKYCPHRTLDMGWQRFLNMISIELGNNPKPPVQEENKPSSVSINVGDIIKITAPYKRYIADDVMTLYGMVQVRENVLAGGEHAFEWLENGIPEKVIDLTDNAGNKRADSDRTHPRKGDYFNFPRTFTVVNVATEGGKQYLKLDFNGKSNCQFWVVAERCQKV